MGLISNLKAISAVKQLKQGKTASLSLAQITSLIINLPDAEINLSEAEFSGVYNLFNEFKKCTTMLSIDLEGYYEICLKIIKTFDAIAPYEKYSGGNELEFSFLMDEIRSSNESLEKNNSSIPQKSEEDYIKNMNLLEAHKMVNQFIDIIASDKLSAYMPFAIPETILPFYHEGWQNTLVKAAKLYIAYLLMWSKQQEYTSGIIDLISTKASCFIPEETAKICQESFELLLTNNGKISSNANITLPTATLFPTDDIRKHYNTMLDYKNNVLLKNWSSETMHQELTDYCYTAYENAGVPYKDGYDVFFYPFYAMREYAKNDKLKQHFSGYEEYLAEYDI